MLFLLLLGVTMAPGQYAPQVDGAANGPAAGRAPAVNAAAPANGGGKQASQNGASDAKDAKNGNGADEEPQPSGFFARLTKAYCDEFFPRAKDESKPEDEPKRRA